MSNRFWDDERVGKLRELVAEGGMSAALAHFSDRSENAIRQACSVAGISLATVAPVRVGARKTSRVATKKLTLEERYEAKIAAAKQRVAQLAAERDAAAASIARRAQDREKAARDRKTSKLEKKLARLSATAETLRAEIRKVKPDYMGPLAGNAVSEVLPIVPGGPLKAKVDKGDADHVRRRLTNFVVPQLVRDLRVEGTAIYACLEQLCKDAQR